VNEQFEKYNVGSSLLSEVLNVAFEEAMDAGHYKPNALALFAAIEKWESEHPPPQSDPFIRGPATPDQPNILPPPAPPAQPTIPPPNQNPAPTKSVKAAMSGKVGEEGVTVKIGKPAPKDRPPARPFALVNTRPVPKAPKKKAAVPPRRKPVAPKTKPKPVVIHSLIRRPRDKGKGKEVEMGDPSDGSTVDSQSESESGDSEEEEEKKKTSSRKPLHEAQRRSDERKAEKKRKTSHRRTEPSKPGVPPPTKQLPDNQEYKPHPHDPNKWVIVFPSPITCPGCVDRPEQCLSMISSGKIHIACYQCSFSKHKCQLVQPRPAVPPLQEESPPAAGPSGVPQPGQFGELNCKSLFVLLTFMLILI
jgi:hypothetical protein